MHASLTSPSPMHAPCLPARSLGALLLVVAVTGCNPARVAATRDYSGPAMPRPERVLVRDFAITPQDVRLDQGIRARLTRATSDQPLSAQQLQVARQANAALSETLVAQLRQAGIPAERIAGEVTPARGNTVLIEGQVVSVDEGNKTRRTLIGLGAGRSSVTADAQLFYRQGAAAPRLLVSFESSADSGHAPGAAATMGVGGAAGSSIAASAAASAGMHGVSERRAASPDDLARKIAEGLAPRIEQYFASQGWVSPNR
ncbi:MAG TPA: DUF4410 domain-containing protein [Acetobacteraceae bacterium]|nr:DUF4410 domain-containing protein [Acetobacteraceae bacterium]